MKIMRRDSGFDPNNKYVDWTDLDYKACYKDLLIADLSLDSSRDLDALNNGTLRNIVGFAPIGFYDLDGGHLLHLNTDLDVVKRMSRWLDLNHKLTVSNPYTGDYTKVKMDDVVTFLYNDSINDTGLMSDWFDSKDIKWGIALAKRDYSDKDYYLDTNDNYDMGKSFIWSNVPDKVWFKKSKKNMMVHLHNSLPKMLFVVVDRVLYLAIISGSKDTDYKSKVLDYFKNDFGKYNYMVHSIDKNSHGNSLGLSWGYKPADVSNTDRRGAPVDGYDYSVNGKYFVKDYDYMKLSGSLSTMDIDDRLYFGYGKRALKWLGDNFDTNPYGFNRHGVVDCMTCGSLMSTSRTDNSIDLTGVAKSYKNPACDTYGSLKFDGDWYLDDGDKKLLSKNNSRNDVLKALCLNCSDHVAALVDRAMNRNTYDLRVR